LLAILLRIGMKGHNVLEISQNLINNFNGLPGLSSKSMEVLTGFSGIGKDKASTIIAAFELGRRSFYKKNVLLNSHVIDPKIVADYFIPLLKNETRETFWVICLNASNKIISYHKVAEGSIDTVTVDQRNVFKPVLENNAVSVILVHNHPSGNLQISDADKSVTMRLIESGKILNIKIIDHIIVAEQNYISFKEKMLI